MIEDIHPRIARFKIPAGLVLAIRLFLGHLFGEVFLVMLFLYVVFQVFVKIDKM